MALLANRQGLIAIAALGAPRRPMFEPVHANSLATTASWKCLLTLRLRSAGSATRVASRGGRRGEFEDYPGVSST
ncbi:MAG: hypothetical protein Ct9H300mP12_08910 [Acidimicrobiales bacterium]|nr:MAG: hypothetical protein Ct9H300mP12_08910 [Acidimicrobiales bacterium]